MSRSRNRNRRSRRAAPLRVSLGDRLKQPPVTSQPHTDPTKVLLPPPPKPARDVVAALMAATGVAIAARPDATVNLLPGSPTTVVISAAGQPAAVFILPLSEAEAQRLLKLPVAEPRDYVLERLFEEERQAAACAPDVVFDAERERRWRPAPSMARAR